MPTKTPETQTRLTAPAQIGRHNSGSIPWTVHLMAYEVYCDVFSPQPSLIEGSCRGGFGDGELVAFLYARNFPRSEWRKRANEALDGWKETR